MRPELALFDLDHTLIPVDSDYEWGEFLGREGLVDALWYRSENERFYAAYRDGSLDIHEFLRFALGSLTSRPIVELEVLHERFMQEVIAPHLTDAARALVRQHQERGDLCAVVTATNAFVTAPIALALGVAHLVATIPEQRAGRFTGRIEGTPCYREGKVERVDEWLRTLGRHWSSFATTTFYSDSHNDLALLQRVAHPVATNADPILRATAQERGWRILDLFDDH